MNGRKEERQGLQEDVVGEKVSCFFYVIYFIFPLVCEKSTLRKSSLS